MRRRFRRWTVRQLTDIERGFNTARQGFVGREAILPMALLSLVLIGPGLLLAEMFSPAGWALLGAGLAFWAWLAISSILALFLGGSYMRTLIWRVPEAWLLRLTQLECPAQDPGEIQIYSTFAARPGWLAPDYGRLTLTTTRLIFQQPRYRFIPPGRLGRRWEFRLNQIESISDEFTSSFGGLARSGRPFPVLVVTSKDGVTLDLSLMAARGWVYAIRRARHACLESSTEST